MPIEEGLRRDKPEKVLILVIVPVEKLLFSRHLYGLLMQDTFKGKL